MDSIPQTSTRRLPFFIVGVLLFLLGPLTMFVLFRMHVHITPWHAPILATAGVVLMAVSTWQRPGIGRIVAFLPFLVLCSIEWLMVGYGMRTPDYAGPAKIGTT